MFPIWDHSAKVRGFSSRAVLPDQVPKYLNSGESFIFDKGNILYGFNLAKNIIREQDNVIVAEGNMDVVALHQYGFKNSVATMGVALSQNSVRLLSNMTKNIFLAMDSDNAGIKAMTRINTDFIKLDIIPKFIDFTPAKDPDEFLIEFGRLELQKRIEDAPTFLDYLIKEEIPKSIPEKTDSKLEILRSIFKILSPMGSNLMANEKVILAAKSLGLKSSNEDILTEYKGYLSKLAPAPKSTFKKQAAPAPQDNAPQSTNNQNHAQNFQNDNYQGPPPQDEPWNMDESYNFEIQGMPAHIDDNTVHIPTNKIAKSEKILLEALLSHPELILAQQITEILDKIEHFEVKRIVQWLKKIYLEIDEAEYSLFVQEKMKESLPDGIKEIMASSLFNYTNLKLDQKVIDKMVTDLNNRLDEGLLRNERDALREKQLNVISDEEGLEVVNEIQQIELKLLALRNK
ncbi:MAG: DNA primase [Bacteriovoracaceae bacterium]|jgi:DNA primase